MFVERKVHYSALSTNLVRWHAGTVSFPLSDIILAQLACPPSNLMLCLHSRITNLSLSLQTVGLVISFGFGERFSDRFSQFPAEQSPSSFDRPFQGRR
jgi:hypothetical protein